MTEKLWHDIEDINNQEIQNKDFSNFEDLEQTDISKKVFEDIFDNFEKQTWEQWKKILESMSDIIEKEGLDDTESIASICMFTEYAIWKFQENAQKQITILWDKNPALLRKMIDSFRDNVKDKERIAENKKEVTENKEITKNINTEIHEAVKNLKSQISQKAPEYEQKLQEQSSNIQKQYPQLNPDEAYLISFSREYEENQEFSTKIWNIDEKTLNILNFVNEKYSDLKINNITSTEKISDEINTFSNEKTDYDEKIKNSLEIENTKIDLKTQKTLSEKYQKLVDNFFQKIIEKNPGKNLTLENLKWNYQKYLNEEKTKYDKIYQKLWEILQEKEQKTIQENFTKNYKEIALEQYTKTIFSMFEHTVWLENISKDFKAEQDKFDIRKGWEINMSFKYKWTPLNITIKPNWDIMMTNFLSKENEDPNHLDIKNEWTFKVQQTKINHFFQFPTLKDILSPEKLTIKINNNFSENLETLINQEVQKKLSKINELWNKELMETELTTNMETQALTHNILKNYKPPFTETSYLEWKSWTIWQNQKGLYYIMWRIDKTIRYEENWLDKLNKIFENSKFKKESDIEVYENIVRDFEIESNEELDTDLEKMINKLVRKKDNGIPFYERARKRIRVRQ